MRQHVNPLSSFFQLKRDLPMPAELFADPTLPIHIDIGCAQGSFIKQLASLEPQFNYLGVEIREALVKSANRKKEELKLTNLNYIFCNVNISLPKWLRSLPPNILSRVSIQFPDPWFKRKHHKRRLLTHSLLISIASAMRNHDELFIQSDLIEVIKPMASLIDSTKYFDSTKMYTDDFSELNYFPIKTEREKYVINQGLPVFRRLYKRNMRNVLILDI